MLKNISKQLFHYLLFSFLSVLVLVLVITVVNIYNRGIKHVYPTRNIQSMGTSQKETQDMETKDAKVSILNIFAPSWCKTVEDAESKIPILLRTCAACKVVKDVELTKCPNCTLISYCGSSCRKNDWKTRHMYECVPRRLDTIVDKMDDNLTIAMMNKLDGSCSYQVYVALDRVLDCIVEVTKREHKEQIYNAFTETLGPAYSVPPGIGMDTSKLQMNPLIGQLQLLLFHENGMPLTHYLPLYNKTVFEFVLDRVNQPSPPFTSVKHKFSELVKLHNLPDPFAVEFSSKSWSPLNGALEFAFSDSSFTKLSHASAWLLSQMPRSELPTTELTRPCTLFNYVLNDILISQNRTYILWLMLQKGLNFWVRAVMPVVNRSSERPPSYDMYQRLMSEDYGTMAMSEGVQLTGELHRVDREFFTIARNAIKSGYMEFKYTAPHLLDEAIERIRKKDFKRSTVWPILLYSIDWCCRLQEIVRPILHTEYGRRACSSSLRRVETVLQLYQDMPELYHCVVKDTIPPTASVSESKMHLLDDDDLVVATDMSNAKLNDNVSKDDGTKAFEIRRNNEAREDVLTEAFEICCRYPFFIDIIHRLMKMGANVTRPIVRHVRGMNNSTFGFTGVLLDHGLLPLDVSAMLLATSPDVYIMKQVEFDTSISLSSTSAPVGIGAMVTNPWTHFQIHATNQDTLDSSRESRPVTTSETKTILKPESVETHPTTTSSTQGDLSLFKTHLKIFKGIAEQGAGLSCYFYKHDVQTSHQVAQAYIAGFNGFCNNFRIFFQALTNINQSLGNVILQYDGRMETRQFLEILLRQTAVRNCILDSDKQKTRQELTTAHRADSVNKSKQEVKTKTRSRMRHTDLGFCEVCVANEERARRSTKASRKSAGPRNLPLVKNGLFLACGKVQCQECIDKHFAMQLDQFIGPMCPGCGGNCDCDAPNVAKSIIE